MPERLEGQPGPGAYTGTMESLVHDYGLFLLFLLIAMESAGIPLPGETALVAAGVLASRGDMNIVAVIAVVGALYLARGFFVPLLIGILASYALRPPVDWLKACGIPRAAGAALLRVTAAFLAGVSKMHWWRFFLWNAAGGIVWAVLVGLVAYYAGQAAADAIARYGLIGGVAIAVLLVVGGLVFHLVRRRMLRAESEA